MPEFLPDVINLDYVNPKWKWDLIYYDVEEYYLRIKITTPYIIKNNRVYVMMTRRRKNIHFHLILQNGFIIKHPSFVKDQMEITKFLNNEFTKFIYKVRNRVTTINKHQIDLGTFYRQLDYLLTHLDRTGYVHITSALKHFLDNYDEEGCTHFVLLECISIGNVNWLSSGFSKTRRDWTRKFQDLFWNKLTKLVGYVSTLYLETQPIKSTKGTYRPKRVSFEEFLEIMENYTRNDIMDFLDHYDVKIHDYYYEKPDLWWRRRLYNTMYRIYDKPDLKPRSGTKGRESLNG